MTNSFALSADVRPPSAKIPAPGYYWVQIAFRYGLQSEHWLPPQWKLVEVTDARGSYRCFGDEEEADWNDAWHMIVVVGPKIEVPA